MTTEQREKLTYLMGMQATLDTEMIKKLSEVIALYREASKATWKRRQVAKMIMTAIKHNDLKRVKVLVEDWRMATKKVARFRL